MTQSLTAACHPCTGAARARLTLGPRARAQGVQGISDIITIPGLVNVDFADVKAIMCNSGTAMLGVGVSTGKNRAEEAAMARARPRPANALSVSRFGRGAPPI